MINIINNRLVDVLVDWALMLFSKEVSCPTDAILAHIYYYYATLVKSCGYSTDCWRGAGSRNAFTHGDYTSINVESLTHLKTNLIGSSFENMNSSVVTKSNLFFYENLKW